MIVKPRERKEGVTYGEWSSVVPPEHHEEKWISVFLYGSRGFSHEQVRHRFRTGVSQRSTRFVDEDGSPWIDHPLVQEFLASESALASMKEMVSGRIEYAKEYARRAYADIAYELQRWLTNKGLNKLTARKQARGAARGYLGNALSTGMIFSASVAQWKRMLRLRCSEFSDAEIRAVFVEALSELKASRYEADFAGFSLKPASDGIGQVAVEV
jgi:thymidylate synthase ThyX